jgi:DNA-binding transcriptional regulator YhcF (GntR family)
MPPLSVPIIIDASARIMIEEGQFTITFRQDTLSFKLPTTRRLAEFLQVPHYYILPMFAAMEEEALVTRAERVGIMTTPEGTMRMESVLKESYPNESRAILGEVLFGILLDPGKGSNAA